MTADPIRDALHAHLRETLLPCTVQDGAVTFDPAKVTDAILPAAHEVIARELDGLSQMLVGAHITNFELRQLIQARVGILRAKQ